jgi:hypothetical protein
MNEEFTWSRLKIFFPEYFSGYSSRILPKIPQIENGKASFRFDNFGVEVSLSQKIPPWLTGITSVENLYYAHAKTILKDIRPELEEVLQIIDGWRPNIKYKDDNGWTGNLEKDVQFVKRKDGASYLDYWLMNETDSRGFPIHPTDKVLAIGKMPRDSLNEKWLKAYGFAKHIVHISGTNCNEVLGTNIVDCATRANELYESVPELEKLEIQVPYPIRVCT